MQILIFVVGLSAILDNSATEKVSPRPSLKSFRDDYDSIAKTCVAVGYVKDNCKNKPENRNTVIAFNAKANGSVQAVSTGNIVMFGDVYLNIGGGFNAVKGVFTAPGVYIFDWTILKVYSKSAYTALYLNGQIKMYNNCHDNNHGIHMLCSKMVVVRMEKGDKASIKCFSGTASVNHVYSSFSGLML
ncbi:cerebellin-1-like [Saccostrea cucullata]|uniref:cerebellin-1-like n=1 Tax=Saccostrea cuccullata TaxID=36930 RepID=UPI002ED3A36D